MEIDGTTPDLKEEANYATENLLDAKSEEKCNRVYSQFISWNAIKNDNIFSENVILAYFTEQAKNKKPSIYIVDLFIPCLSVQ